MRILVCLVPLVLSGCYSYLPRTYAELDPAVRTEVAIEFTDAGVVAASATLGPGVLRVEGRLQKVSRDSIVIAASRTVARDGQPVSWYGETVGVARADILRISQRQLDRRKTLLVVGGVIAVGGSVLKGSGVGGGSNEDGGSGGGGPNGAGIRLP